MYTLPTALELNGNHYDIRDKADYRLILDVCENIKEAIVSNPYTGRNTVSLDYLYTALILFFKDFKTIQEINSEFPDIQQVLKEIYKFINCGKDEEEYPGKKTPQILDWKQDEQLIVPAINAVVGYEIRSVEYMHWWTFLGHYSCVGEGLLTTVVGIRKKIATGKKLEKYEKEIRKEYPQYFNRDHKKQDMQFKQFLENIVE